MSDDKSKDLKSKSVWGAEKSVVSLMAAGLFAFIGAPDIAAAFIGIGILYLVWAWAWNSQLGR